VEVHQEKLAFAVVLGSEEKGRRTRQKVNKVGSWQAKRPGERGEEMKPI